MFENLSKYYIVSSLTKEKELVQCLKAIYEIQSRDLI